MAEATAPIRFQADLRRPASPKGATWSFLVLPAMASAQLPTRSMTTVEGTIAGRPSLPSRQVRTSSLNTTKFSSVRSGSAPMRRFSSAITSLLFVVFTFAAAAVAPLVSVTSSAIEPEKSSTNSTRSDSRSIAKNFW